MRKIGIESLNDNMFEAIGKEWMLVTAGTSKHFNTMTASWGGIGFLWAKNVAFVFIRPERYTHEFVEANEWLTLSFLGEEHKTVHKICGSQSGRDTDKIKETGLTPVITENDSVTFEEARLVLECRKLFKEQIRPECFLDKEIAGKWYNDRPGGSFHDMYIVEIVNVFVK